MKKIMIEDKDGKFYTAYPARNHCSGCCFFKKYDDHSLCNAPPETYCGGLIYQPATDEELAERNKFDKSTLWLIVITIVYLAAFAALFIHFFSKLN